MKYGIPNGTGSALLGRDDFPGKDESEGFTEKDATKKLIRKKKAAAFGKIKK